MIRAAAASALTRMTAIKRFLKSVFESAGYAGFAIAGAPVVWPAELTPPER